MSVERATTIQGWMTPRELHWLADQVSTRLAVLEVGAWKGRASRVILDHLPESGILTVVDHWQGQGDPTTGVDRELARRGSSDVYEEFCRNVKDELLAMRVHVLKESSDRAAEILAAAGHSFDLIFIDGDHEESAVAKDIEQFLPLVRPGGLLCGHDYGHAGVRRAVQNRFGMRVSHIPHIWWVTVHGE